MTGRFRKWWAFALACYGLVMLWLLFGQRWGQWNGTVNLHPFDTLRRFIWVLRYSSDPAQLRHAVVNLAGNVVMFVPLGFLLPCVLPKLCAFWRHLLWMLALILTVELLQWWTGLGTCDVDDLLLNLVGTTAGYLLFAGLNHLLRRRAAKNQS